MREGTQCLWFLNTIMRAVFGSAVAYVHNLATWHLILSGRPMLCIFFFLFNVCRFPGPCSAHLIWGLTSCVALWGGRDSSFSSFHDKTVDVNNESPLQGIYRFLLLTAFLFGAYMKPKESLSREINCHKLRRAVAPHPWT